MPGMPNAGLSTHAGLRQAHNHSRHSHPLLARWVCIVSEAESMKFVAGVPMGHRCRSVRHHHYTVEKVQHMVKLRELVWVGQHHKIAKFRDHMAWAKIYNRNQYSEVINAGMQLVRGLR